MAAGTHWEWRGFGLVTPDFMAHFDTLEPYLPAHLQEDIYIWAPGLDVNLKLRESGDGFLKFKRFIDRDGELEKWGESANEYYGFPIGRQVWQALEMELARAGLRLAPYAGQPADLAFTLDAVQEAGGGVIRASKRREVRAWPGPNGRVLVESTIIRKPQPVLTVALESAPVDEEGDTEADARAKADLRAAMVDLELDRQPLEVMNYLAAISIWGSGGRI